MMAKDIIGADDFVEVFVDTSLEECEARDVKGLYKKARAGEIPNFTGIHEPFESPLDPDVRLRTEDADVQQWWGGRELCITEDQGIRCTNLLGCMDCITLLEK